ncbi:RNA polymerase III C5 subunit [Cryptosporidium canis]|uniref:RNA polymerase III C5 subunit n=1 Tax=Cryptosporidium canis TaxID=195482 RepID=A0ABQ8P8Y6_9CRYT|nr:RNA polymerase III C5 subunit [Cryptosporidium canis]KAJ1612855.1 RNA polymerase III C5 subunit [Cryptosporidium canis]
MGSGKKERSNRYLECTTEGPRNVGGYGYIGSNELSSVIKGDNYRKQTIEEIIETIDIKVNELRNDYINFDISGIDASIANALRRILLVEIPTVAIETVQIYQNNGVIQDEVLAHRLGLIPMLIDPNTIEFRSEDEDLNEKNSVCFRLNVRCTRDDINHDKGITSKAIYSKDLVWVPLSDSQKKKFGSNPPRVVMDDILITKLRPGQSIEAILYCEKNIGRVHAKWSPVCTASYRLLPEFGFPNGPISGPDAQRLRDKVCPMKVFDIEEATGNVFAKNPRNCTTCRACIEQFPNQIKLLKDKFHFIFSIETTGSIPPVELVKTAIDILRKKGEKIKSSVKLFYEQ